MSLRILHVLDHSLPLQSGYSFRTAALLREQRKLGWETFHVTTPKHYADGPDEEEVADLSFFRTASKGGLLRKAPILDNAIIVRDTAKRIDEIWDRVKPDIVHAHSPCLTGLAALSVARKRGVPVVYEIRATWEDAAVDHGTTSQGSLRYRMTRMLETKVVKGAQGIAVICEGLAQEFASRGIPRDQITIVRNAVDIRDFQPITDVDTEIQHSLGLGDGPVFGFIGSLYGYEGIDLLLRAMPELLRSHPNASVLLVGGGPVEVQLKSLARELGLAERVRFVGRVPNKEVPRFYSVIDVLVYPRKSTRLTELVTPLKPLEAMALTRMFIASDVGGHRELIPEAFRGNLFRADDPADLARVASQVLADRVNWSVRLSDARKYVETQCTWAHSAANYKTLYARALGRSSVTARALA
jgi:glycogen(starch) synthase